MKLIATLTAAVTAAMLVAAPAQADDPVRVLILGDSVTHASNGEYSWRYFAWKGLEQAGSEVDFVGPHQGSFIEGDTWGGTYADPAFDTDHAARWGLSLLEMLAYPGEEAPTIGALVAEHNPDVIVEHFGVIDLAWFHLTVDEMAAQVRRFVTDARAVKPDVDVVLASVPQTWIPQAPAYNAALPGIAAELSTDASRVVATPVADFTEGVDTIDSSHPSTVGQQKLAAAVTVAFDALGLAVNEPAPPPPGPGEEVSPPETGEVPPPQVVPEIRPAKPRKVWAADRGVRTRVDWRRAARADRYVVRCGKARRVVRRTKASLRTNAGRCRVRSVNETGRSRWVRVRVRR